jgi:hypothetical protein
MKNYSRFFNTALAMLMFGVSTTRAQQATSNIPLRPLEQSSLVIKAADGSYVVAQKNGGPVDGIKLSQHDTRIGSPSVAVGTDGTIHVAFVEQHRTTLANAVYYRGSSDGGKTWTDAKNLSEDMVGFDVGLCYVVVDARNRVYVIWRAAVAAGWQVTVDPAGVASNLWYRELDGAKWSKPIPVYEPVTEQAQRTQQSGAFSYFAAVDAAGQAQVIWNTNPDFWHPELLTYNSHSNGVGKGLVFQVTLDGTSVGKPRAIFLPVLGGLGLGNRSTPSCDDLDTLNGYFDSTGAAHFVASVSGLPYSVNPHPPVYDLIENGKAGQSVNLPPLSFHAARDIPTLLVDAKGKQHLIALFIGGEHPNIRDYPLGTDDDATVIRAAVGLNGAIAGFQAYQGPGGRMAVIMQMNDTGDRYSGNDSWVSISTGDGKWSVPVNVTNNSGRKTFHNTQTSSQSNIATLTSCVPGPAAAAFDRDGHLILVMVKGEYTMVLATAFGVNTAGGDVIVPTLRFLKF